MTRFSWYGYEAQVDEQATRGYYEKAGEWDCSCGHCRNFLALARGRKLPEELLAILNSLSIPPEKATYVCELDDRDWKEKGLLYQISWRVAGEVVKKPESNQNEGTPWGPPVQLSGFHLMLGHEIYPYGAPGFPQPNFDLDVSLYLPWVLDEPVEGPSQP